MSVTGPVLWACRPGQFRPSRCEGGGYTARIGTGEHRASAGGLDETPELDISIDPDSPVIVH
jgi:hypothetical protein